MANKGQLRHNPSACKAPGLPAANVLDCTSMSGKNVYSITCQHRECWVLQVNFSTSHEDEMKHLPAMGNFFILLLRLWQFLR